MTTSTLTVTDFVLARLDEDELGVLGAERSMRVAVREYLLKQYEAMRKIVEHCDFDHLTLSPGDPHVISILASIWSDHPDWREEWRT